MATRHRQKYSRWGYGLGIQLIEAEISELGKFTFIGHGGTTPSGFGAGMWFYPEFGVIPISFNMATLLL